jgi:peroxiredoxin/predicted 2-oxoglutarate/Fe(II)-dependent dioxygenase YbiX
MVTELPKLRPGDPFPWIHPRTPSMASFSFDSMAGRYLILCLFGTMADPAARSAMQAVADNLDLYDDDRMSFFGVSCDPQDEARKRISDRMPGIRIFWDFDGAVCKAVGSLPPDATLGGGAMVMRRMWIVVDPTLHVLATFPLRSGDRAHERVFKFLRGLRPPQDFAGFEIPAPVLVLPNVLEPALCRRLIELYEADGGKDTGVMRGDGGVIDYTFKRRKDYVIEDQALRRNLLSRIARRVVPEIRKLFFMEVTRMERYLVGCYAAEDNAHFQPHRDNRSPLTQHRRFAVSINLNDAFDGGEVWFPEYNRRGIKAPPGWAVVFPCAILHAVSRVTSGRRYAFLPFVFDDEGEKIFEAAYRKLKAEAGEPPQSETAR